ncbi:MAG: phosphoglycerate dehydrogenase [Bacteroidota bacterium]
MPRVLITDNLAPVCHDLLAQHSIDFEVHLKKSEDELAALAGDFDGWIIRSGTTINANLIDHAAKLKVIGRAGVGVDNIDLDAATRKGILVVNAPDGNTISTAEHTCAMMQTLARRIPHAHASVTAGEWARKQFSGAELLGKTLGVVGVGKIGRAVARRMQGFEMRVLGFDPVLGEDAARRLGIDLVDLPTLFAESDYITVHTPLNDATRGLLNAETLAQCKDGVRLVNCARGGIIDEPALLGALVSGKVAGAALDVFSEEPLSEALLTLAQHPRVVATPHIAASTGEAQEKVAVQITEQVVRALQGDPVSTPVNAGALRAAAQPEAKPFLDLADRLGQIASQLVDGSLRRITVRSYGEALHRYAEVLTVAALRGVMARWSPEPVNLINASTLAREMGLHTSEEWRTSSGDYDYPNLVEVIVETADRTRSVIGTVRAPGDGRLVGLDGYRFEGKPAGHLLFYRNVDRPGMLATVGGILAEAEVNIAALALGRSGPGAVALTVISTDEAVPADVRRRVEAIEGVEDVRVVAV